MHSCDNEAEKLRRKIDAARYAMERFRFTTYAKEVIRGELLLEALPGKMRAAMENFDQILKEAAEDKNQGEIYAAQRKAQKDYVVEFRSVEDRLMLRMTGDAKK
jgi:hypothetical protein